jgi:acetylornithine deacetylase/succinyl-diaminopimelate desuccinylase-like protein
MLRPAALVFVLAFSAGAFVPAQQRDVGAVLMADPAVKAAVQGARDDERRTIEDQVRLCQIPAPPFKEGARAKAFAESLRALGLENVRIDKEGNVLGERRGLAPTPHLVFSAHLDTVFPEGTDVTVRREGSVLRGPGIGDDCRGLAVVLAVVRALNAARVQTPGTITFVGTVGEEGLGDLRGVKALFRETLRDRVDRFVSIDGTGLGITHIGVGSLRYRVAFKGPGGHSYGAFGLANPIHALGRAIARIADFDVARDPKTTFNVGRVGGGTSVNSIAYESWMEVDMRSADAAALKSLDASFHKAVDTALAEENERWNNNGRLTVEKRIVGDRPAGRTAVESPIVEAAVSVTRALGLPVSLDEGSTDSNIPMSLNIPAVTIDGGGRGTGAHSLGETFDATNSWQGTQRATLLAIALAR